MKAAKKNFKTKEKIKLFFEKLNNNFIGIGCGIVFSLGLVVIFGWYSGNKFLIQILPSFAPMQFNTALCFVLSSISLFSLYKSKNLVGKFSAYLVLFISFTTLL